MEHNSNELYFDEGADSHESSTSEQLSVVKKENSKIDTIIASKTVEPEEAKRFAATFTSLHYQYTAEQQETIHDCTISLEALKTDIQSMVGNTPSKNTDNESSISEPSQNKAIITQEIQESTTENEELTASEKLLQKIKKERAAAFIEEIAPASEEIENTDSEILTPESPLDSVNPPINLDAKLDMGALWTVEVSSVLTSLQDVFWWDKGVDDITGDMLRPLIWQSNIDGIFEFFTWANVLEHDSEVFSNLEIATHGWLIVEWKAVQTFIADKSWNAHKVNETDLPLPEWVNPQDVIAHSIKDLGSNLVQLDIDFDMDNAVRYIIWRNTEGETVAMLVDQSHIAMDDTYSFSPVIWWDIITTNNRPASATDYIWAWADAIGAWWLLDSLASATTDSIKIWEYQERWIHDIHVPKGWWNLLVNGNPVLINDTTDKSLTIPKWSSWYSVHSNESSLYIDYADDSGIRRRISIMEKENENDGLIYQWEEVSLSQRVDFIVPEEYAEAIAQSLQSQAVALIGWQDVWESATEEQRWTLLDLIQHPPMWWILTLDFFTDTLLWVDLPQLFDKWLEHLMDMFGWILPENLSIDSFIDAYNEFLTSAENMWSDLLRIMVWQSKIDGWYEVISWNNVLERTGDHIWHAEINNNGNLVIWKNEILDGEGNPVFISEDPFAIEWHMFTDIAVWMVQLDIFTDRDSMTRYILKADRETETIIAEKIWINDMKPVKTPYSPIQSDILIWDTEIPDDIWSQISDWLKRFFGEAWKAMVWQDAADFAHSWMTEGNEKRINTPENEMGIESLHVPLNWWALIINGRKVQLWATDKAVSLPENTINHHTELDSNGHLVVQFRDNNLVERKFLIKKNEWHVYSWEEVEIEWNKTPNNFAPLA